MARDYGQIQHRIWADPDWRTLDADTQLLYFLLLSQPSMNQAGVLPFQLRKWAGCVAGWDTGTVTKTLHRLSDARFIVLDEDTEEVLVRSFIRNDGSYRIPGVLKSALKFAVAAQSQTIRSALADELGRLPKLEGKTAMGGMSAIAETRVALEPIGGPFPDPFKEPFPDPFKEPIPDPMPDGFVSNPSPIPSTEPIGEPIPEPPLSVSGSVSSLSHVRNRGGERLSAPPRCARHDELPIGDEPPCRACQRLRESREVANEEALRRARLEAAKPKPPCPEHFGEDRDNCRCCAADRKAAS